MIVGNLYLVLFMTYSIKKLISLAKVTIEAIIKVIQKKQNDDGKQVLQDSKILRFQNSKIPKFQDSKNNKINIIGHFRKWLGKWLGSRANIIQKINIIIF